MNQLFYERISEPFRTSEKKRQALIYANQILTVLVYIAYPFALIFAYQRSIYQLLISILIPAVAFVLLSMFRSWCHAPRPYEVWNIKPVIRKETKGNSFPSRHVFSSFVISMVIFQLSAPFGMAYFLISVGIAILRVIGGVHFLKDVIVGAAAGVCSWYFGVILVECFIKKLCC